MLTFLSPLFLLGMLAAAIPLVIHLSRSRRTRKMQFSTTRFFTDQFLRSYRMSRLKELFLLACRMALCALFAVALASPIVLPRGRAVVGGQSRSVVVVLDNSATMGAEQEGGPIFQTATNTALEILDELQTGDTAALVLAARRSSGPETPFLEPTPTLGDVRQAIQSASVGALGTDLASAVARAAQIVEKTNAQSKEVYILSDLQDSGWPLPDDVEADAAQPIDRTGRTHFFFVRMRPPESEGLAVTAIQYAASRPMVGVPFAFRPHVKNQGKQPRSCIARLAIDGQVVAERRLDLIAGGRWALPRFHHTFSTGGWHEGYVEIDDPLIEADNRRYFAFQVVDSVRVLAINGAPSKVARLDELFFLKAALAAASAAESPIPVDTAAPEALGQTDLAPFRVVILANVESMPDAAVERLETFVDAGGSLLMFTGDRASPKFHNNTLAGAARLHGGLAPGRLQTIQGESAPKPSKRMEFRLQSVDFEHAALSAFADLGFARLEAVGFQALWGIEPVNSRVLMRTDAGSPVFIEKSFGKGRVMLFASSCDRDWTDFPVRPAWLPFVYRVVGYLAQEPAQRQEFYRTGDVFHVKMSAVEGLRQVLVRAPDKSIQTPVAGDDPSIPLVFADTDQPGVYTMYTPGREEKGERFVANLESFESDLTWLDEVFAQREGQDPATAISAETQEPSPDESSPAHAEEPGAETLARIEDGFSGLLGGTPLVSFVSDPKRVHEASLISRRGMPLWDLALIAALAVALFEPWLANRISMLHYGRPKEPAPSRLVRPGTEKNVIRSNEILEYAVSVEP